jgi:hypothetical protein
MAGLKTIGLEITGLKIKGLKGGILQSLKQETERSWHTETYESC